jgi:hypothetical protein
MSDGAFCLRKLAPELRFVYETPPGGCETTVLLDPDSPENLKRNIAELPPTARIMLTGLLRSALTVVEAGDA